MKNKKHLITFLVILLIVVMSSILFYKFVYTKPQTFRGKILEINENMITVEVTEPDSKFSGEYILKINDKTSIEVMGTQIHSNYSYLNDLFKNPMAEITFFGRIDNTNPATINHILKINILTEKTSVSLLVFLEKNITIEDQKDIKQKIQSIDGVGDIEFKSKEEFKNDNMPPELKDTLDSLEENPLNDAFLVYINDIDKKDKIIQIIENIDKVENVKY